MWEIDVSEYFKTCDRFQEENKSIGKILGNMIKIEEPGKPWENVHMDWVIVIKPGDDTSYNECLVIVDRCSKNQIFLPCHKDITAVQTALLIWNRVISWTGILTNIISERDTNFTSELWTNLHQLFAKRLSSSTAYQPQTKGLAKRMIQTLGNMVRRICAYV
ncbi:hypothetical protein O181_133922 [Austropuccinia psidii MF-1]|uniref:Integrase catalytic domain-containing protein n=1 Tax=Austropuccinia psidii MF-1 TaxID=1389203 RepID=A0A9Q3L7H9_9BASI|nr:hypothetical protein [Austropuccinia psidii MF-1]